MAFWRALLALALAAACAAPSAVLSSSPATPALQLDPDEQRKPFALELPDLDGLTITAPEARIPHANLQRLRLHVRQPAPDAISYGRIYTKINGESAGTIQESRPSRDGYVITCDLARWPRFRLRPGKNVIEVEATDKVGRAYYASYVLLTGGRSVGDEAAAAGASIESLPVAAGADRLPPAVRLLQPNGAVRPRAQRVTVRVSGLVADDSGVVASVTVNGSPASLTPATGARGIAADLGAAAPPSPAKPAFHFAGEAVVDDSVAAVVIEAKDGAGNLARITVPVRRRAPAVSGRFTGRKLALVVGVSRYKFHDGGLTDLAFAGADARAIRDFLTSPRGGAFAVADVLFLEDEQATLAAVRGGLTRLLNQAGPQDLVFVFIASHGGPDRYDLRKLYFWLHDTKLSDMPNTAFAMSEFKNSLDSLLRAERVVVLVDTCHSGAVDMGGPRGGARGENNLVNLYAEKLFAEKGTAVLTASDVNEQSWENKRWGGGHGVFTWAVLEGLRGEADSDGDRLITAGELFFYVRDRVRVETEFKQNPRALPNLNLDFPLAVVQSQPDAPAPRRGAK